MTTADRVTKLASQLLGDLDAVDTAAYDRAAADQQKLQLIAEAFERVGEIALGQPQVAEVPAGYTKGPGGLYPTVIDANNHDRPQEETQPR
jgi:hypothetical protein